VQSRIANKNALSEFHSPNVAKMSKKNFTAFRKYKKSITSVEDINNKSRAAGSLY